MPKPEHNWEHGCTVWRMISSWGFPTSILQHSALGFLLCNSNKKNPTWKYWYLFAKFNILMKQLQPNFSFSHIKSYFTPPQVRPSCVSAHTLITVELFHWQTWCDEQDASLAKSWTPYISLPLLQWGFTNQKPKLSLDFLQRSALHQTVSTWTRPHPTPLQWEQN